MGLSRSRQRLEPQVWVSAGSQNQSPAGGEGQLSSGGVKRYTRFVFVVWAERWVSGSRETRLPGGQIRATVKMVLREDRRSVARPHDISAPCWPPAAGVPGNTQVVLS